MAVGIIESLLGNFHHRHYGFSAYSIPGDGKAQKIKCNNS